MQFQSCSDDGLVGHRLKALSLHPETFRYRLGWPAEEVNGRGNVHKCTREATGYFLYKDLRAARRAARIGGTRRYAVEHTLYTKMKIPHRGYRTSRHIARRSC